MNRTPTIQMVGFDAPTPCNGFAKPGFTDLGAVAGRFIGPNFPIWPVGSAGEHIITHPTSRRRSLHLTGYDYSQAGAYFVTVCTLDRRCWLGSIVDGSMAPSPAGRIVEEVWNGLPARFPGIDLDVYSLMPNHVHGILLLPDRSKGVAGPSLGEIVRVLKAVAARRVRLEGDDTFAWQRNYYEHVIRSEAELDRVRDYIVNNPLQWALDRENPEVQPVMGRGRDVFAQSV